MSEPQSFPEFVRLGPTLIQQVIDRLREINCRKQTGQAWNVSHEFQVPISLVFEVWKNRATAVETARIAWAARNDLRRKASAARAIAPAEPPGRPLLPITREQAHLIVQRWREDDPYGEPRYSVEEIAGSLGLALDVVVACLTDAGYSLAEVES